MRSLNGCYDSAEALMFDDVLVIPTHSEVLPAETNISSRLTEAITLNIPLLSAAMDHVSDARPAIALAVGALAGKFFARLSGYS